MRVGTHFVIFRRSTFSGTLLRTIFVLVPNFWLFWINLAIRWTVWAAWFSLEDLAYWFSLILSCLLQSWNLSILIRVFASVCLCQSLCLSLCVCLYPILCVCSYVGVCVCSVMSMCMWVCACGWVMVWFVKNWLIVNVRSTVAQISTLVRLDIFRSGKMDSSNGWIQLTCYYAHVIVDGFNVYYRKYNIHFSTFWPCSHSTCWLNCWLI